MDWIQENIYFSGLLAFQALYYSFPDKMPLAIAVLFTFFPYHSIRHFVPKTSFRRSMTSKTETTKQNRAFMIANLVGIKAFYMIAKWVQGFFVNYLIFEGVLRSQGPTADYLMRWLFLLAGWGTTIAMFLHTLKFKKYIGARVSMLLYTGSFPFFLVAYCRLAVLCWQQAEVLALALVGMLLNFVPSYPVQFGWQAACYAWLGFLRSGRA